MDLYSIMTKSLPWGAKGIYYNSHKPGMVGLVLRAS